ncbi:carboxylating nicotinate-nucleotide diphosphorylase [Candidatus Micrarchaeota archaeon]|nr:carboxylating nicotinate-nucleotide diphosphorylase [Candidatus Micrarchaeota archaeon]
MDKKTIFDRSLGKFEQHSKERALTALEDDSAPEDITTRATIRKTATQTTVRAFIHVKETGVLCGISEASAVLKGLKLEWKKREGEKIKKGEIVCIVRGDVRKILRNCRVALNYLQILSGIATKTRRLVEKFGARVCALRKTHPCISFSEKRAVQAGGGFTHRLNLSDGFLIKDNHIAAVATELFGKQKRFTEKQKIKAMEKCILRCASFRSAHHFSFPIEVEVESLAQAIAAAQLKKKTGAPNVIMLDNRTPKQVKQIVQAIRKINSTILIEASGGITEKNISSYLKAGADVVSTSELILNAKSLDFSLTIEGYK